jgi:chromosomal replication initiator protein
MESIWTEVKNSLKNRIQMHSYRMWIEPLVFIHQTADNGFKVACPNLFSKRRVMEHYRTLIETEIKKVVGKEFQLKLVVDEKIALKDRQKPSQPLQLQLPNMTTRPHGGRLLRKDFTFDEFVVGGNNDFAYSAALRLATKCSNQSNALFLLSKTGMGKSHLSQAIGHHILSEFPLERVFYMTAEDFTNEMVDSFKNNCISSFKEKYRNNCDVLLLEDVHYISGKSRTQIELASTFDMLFNANKKIIFSSCYLPNEIPKLNDNMRSRLSFGIISGIEKPGFRTRVRILKKKAKRMGYSIPKDVIEYLAGELVDDIRQLESGLIGVAARASLMGIPVNTKLARSVVDNIARQSKEITIDGIKKLVSKYFNVSINDLVSRSRKQAIVRPRQMAIYLARRYTDQSVQIIGKAFNRYHATALHAIKTVEQGIKKNTRIQKQIEYLSSKLESGEFH